MDIGNYEWQVGISLIGRVFVTIFIWWIKVLFKLGLYMAFWGGVDSGCFLGALRMGIWIFFQFGMAVTIILVDGLYGINLFNIDGCILIGYFYNKTLLKGVG